MSFESYSSRTTFRSVSKGGVIKFRITCSLQALFSAAIVSSWALPAAHSKHCAALDTLTRLQVLGEPPKAAAAPEPAYRLNKAFSQHVRGALCSGTDALLTPVPDEVTAAAPTRETVNAWAAGQWESLLLFAVGGGPSPVEANDLSPNTPLRLDELLVAAGVISQQNATVTEVGFQFLLSDTYSQLWALLREYIARAERQSSAELASVLGFLLQLGFQGERPLAVASLDPQQQDIAAHMAQLGLLAAFRVGGVRGQVWLRPTRLAVLAASGSAAGAATGASDDGYVVVETNARVYAYTSSPVRQAILRLFVRCDVLLPNLFVGTITRESVMSALDSGVGAEQIVSYLRQHAHARVASRVPIVPGVVADQIRLWQREMRRLGSAPGVLYRNFEGEELYRRVAAYAEELGVALARDDARRELVGAADAHPKLRDKIKEVKTTLGY
jgi:transcription initiation factor TFIIH subunit 4